MQKSLLLIFLSLFYINLQAQKDSVYFTTKAVTRVAVNSDYDYQLQAYDSAEDIIFCVVKKFPAGLTWNPNGQELSGKIILPSELEVERIPSSFSSRGNSIG